MKTSRMSVGVLAFTLFISGVVHADDVADVTAAEVAFNAAQNAGSISGMAKFFLPGRTIFGPGGGGLGVGWTDESLARRQAEFDAGRKIDYRIEKLDVRLYGGTAVSTFERIGTVKEIGTPPRDSHLRITGVWVKVNGQWKLAHRHESPF
jgi:ketosteroid isomerase-like protein